MTDEDITTFNEKITEKLGKENAAVIADDIGVLITKHSESKREQERKEKELNDLRKMNERLTAANASLIHQISTDELDTAPRTRNQKQESEPEPFNFRDAFDEKGRFKK